MGENVVMNIFIDPRFETGFRSDPLVLVDVGARGGLKKDWQPAARHLQVIGFEPEAREYEALRARTPEDGKLRLFGVALHNRPGTVTFQVTRDRGLSSIFEPNRRFLDGFPEADRFEVTERVDVETATLDALVAATPAINDIDFLKVDTQGSELFVLEGAARVLRDRAVGVEVEVEFNQIYKDQPLFGDVDRLLRGAGFELFDLRPVYWKRTAGRDAGGPRGQIMWGDALYLKSADGLASVLEIAADRRRTKLLKAIAVAVLYGYFDYAIELAGAGGVLSAADRDVIVRHLTRDTPAAAFPGQRTLAAGLRRLWRAILPRDDRAWSISRGRVGNRD
jgi:FkbM family methyltransferase